MKKKILSLAVLLSLVTVQTQINAGGGKVAGGVLGGLAGGVLLSQMLRSNNNSNSDDGEVVEVKSSRRKSRSASQSSCSRCRNGCKVSNKGKSQKRRCLGGCSRNVCSRKKS